MNSCLICVHYLNKKCNFNNGCVLSKRFIITTNKKQPYKKEIKGILINELAFYIPQTDTVYYNKDLNNYPILKKECIRHEKQHSRLFKGKMTCYKILQNLEFELRDSLKWRLNKKAYKEYTLFINKFNMNIQELNKATKTRHFLMMKLIYTPIYSLTILTINCILIPYYLYIDYWFKHEI